MDFDFDYEDYRTAQVLGTCLGCGTDTEPANEHEFEVVCGNCIEAVNANIEASNDDDLPF